MPFIETGIEDLYVFEPRVFEDHRGYFMESFSARSLAAIGQNINFVQDNESMSHRGVVRGMHYQTEPFGMAKLVRVVRGEVIDIVLDIREDSKTYGQSFAVHLSEENKKQLLVPRGFAHGFVVLRDNTVFSYKCDNYYMPAYEAGIKFHEDNLGVQIPIPFDERKFSDKDLILPEFGNHKPYKTK